MFELKTELSLLLAQCTLTYIPTYESCSASRWPVAGLNLALSKDFMFWILLILLLLCLTWCMFHSTRIKTNKHQTKWPFLFFCMIWLKWGKHIWQSWPKMSEKIMDLSLQISLVFRKPLQLRKGFKGARATIEICQLAADSFSQGNINRYLWLLIHKTKHPTSTWPCPHRSKAKCYPMLIRKAVHGKEMEKKT